MSRYKNEVRANIIETCDNCDKKASVLWRDNRHYFLCPTCWPFIHFPSKARLKEIEKYNGSKNEQN